MDNYIVILSVPGSCYQSVKKEMGFRNPHGEILRVVRKNGQRKVSAVLRKGVDNG